MRYLAIGFWTTGTQIFSESIQTDSCNRDEIRKLLVKEGLADECLSRILLVENGNYDDCPPGIIKQWSYEQVVEPKLSEQQRRDLEEKYFEDNRDI